MTEGAAEQKALGAYLDKPLNYSGSIFWKLAVATSGKYGRPERQKIILIPEEPAPLHGQRFKMTKTQAGLGEKQSGTYPPPYLVGLNVKDLNLFRTSRPKEVHGNSHSWASI